MKKSILITLLLALSNISNALNISEYQVSGYTNYLKNNDIKALSKLLIKDTGNNKNEEDIEKAISKVQKYLDDKYNNQYAVILEDQEINNGIVVLTLEPKISNVIINGDDIYKVEINSLKKGAKVSDILRRDIEFNKANPFRAFNINYRIDKNGKVDAIVDIYGRKTEHAHYLKYGYENNLHQLAYRYTNSALTELNDTLALTLDGKFSKLINGFGIGLSYNLPIQQANTLFDIEALYSFQYADRKMNKYLTYNTIGGMLSIDTKFTHYINIPNIGISNAMRVYEGYTLIHKHNKQSIKDVELNNINNTINRLYFGTNGYIETDTLKYNADIRVNVMKNIFLSYYSKIESKEYNIGFTTKGQLSPKGLLDDEKMSIGGANAVRGYTDSRFKGDNTLIMSLDIKNKDKNAKNVKVYEYMDYGLAHNMKENKFVDIASIGGGATWDINRDGVVLLDFNANFKLRNRDMDKELNGNKADANFGLSLSSSF